MNILQNTMELIRIRTVTGMKEPILQAIILVVKKLFNPTGKIIRVVETGGFVKVSSTVTQYF